jgi:succinate-semialdehyde dehydrogenase / glutarate-semialdehyde dehydrogenase
MSIRSINPFNNQVLREYPEFSSSALEVTMLQAEKAFEEWKRTSYNFRRECMIKCSEYLLNNKQSLAELIVLEMGKPIKEAKSEIEKCAWACDYFAVMAQDFLKDEYIGSDATESFISYEPLGTILAIMPWNFPFWQLFRFAVPALMAGNTAILKHASNVPQCALAIEDAFRNSGFPDGVFQTILIESDKVEFLLNHDIIKAVSLTGSEFAGSQVASVAGRNIKKCVLELGGSDAFIVLKDADLNMAAEQAVRSRLINTGQSCIAAKRFIVVREVYDEFMQAIIEKVAKYTIGNPMEEATDLGPMAREDLAQGLIRQINRSKEKGAEVVYGGGRPDMEGSFVNPAILANISPGMPAYEEELFGPVFSTFNVKDEKEALRIANDTKYGLGGSVWTEDVKKGIWMAKQIHSGAVFVNGMVKSDPRLPFGGIKSSGYGKELSELGIKEFVNAKTIWVK